eukprot:2338280-Prymnesium_polylepis.1
MEQHSAEQSADVKVVSRILRAALACRARGRLRTPCAAPSPPVPVAADPRRFDWSSGDSNLRGHVDQADEGIRPPLVLTCAYGTHCTHPCTSECYDSAFLAVRARRPTRSTTRLALARRLPASTLPSWSSTRPSSRPTSRWWHARRAPRSRA